LFKAGEQARHDGFAFFRFDHIHDDALSLGQSFDQFCFPATGDPNLQADRLESPGFQLVDGALAGVTILFGLGGPGFPGIF
jgi:hypothetical protein